MRLQRVAAILLRQFYLLRGSPARVVPMFAWVAIDIVLWGFLTRYLNSVASSGFNFVPTLLGAALLWDFLARVMMGVTMAFFEDVWSRNFLNIFATPMSISEYVAGLVLSSVVTTSVGLAVMLVLHRRRGRDASPPSSVDPDSGGHVLTGAASSGDPSAPRPEGL